MSPVTLAACDIGGTTCRLGLFHRDGTGLVLTARQDVPTGKVPDVPSLFEAIKNAFGRDALSSCAACAAACAGPVENGRVRLSNAAAEYAEGQGAPVPFRIINDFAAVARSILTPAGEAAVPVLHCDMKPSSGQSVMAAIGPGSAVPSSFRGCRPASCLQREGMFPFLSGEGKNGPLRIFFCRGSAAAPSPKLMTWSREEGLRPCRNFSAESVCRPAP